MLTDCSSQWTLHCWTALNVNWLNSTARYSTKSVLHGLENMATMVLILRVFVTPCNELLPHTCRHQDCSVYKNDFHTKDTPKVTMPINIHFVNKCKQNSAQYNVLVSHWCVMFHVCRYVMLLKRFQSKTCNRLWNLGNHINGKWRESNSVRLPSFN